MQEEFYPRPVTNKRYYQFSEYLKNKFGKKVYKITLDAGFSCPNRDGTISSGGCIFCDDGGSFSRAHDSHMPVEQQVLTGIETLSTKFKAQKFMSYFQAYTNTYKPVDELKKIYDASLCHKDIVGISIGTRPDCVDEQKLDLIASYTQNYETWIEYGLQSIHDKTLKYINRGHNYETFLKAYKLTKERNIKVGVHVILGLPDEKKEDMLQVEYPNCFLLDMGWYQDRYIISVIHNFDWANPVQQYETTETNQLPKLLTEAVGLVEKESRSAVVN